jgi:hypothetical protein
MTTAPQRFQKPRSQQIVRSLACDTRLRESTLARNVSGPEITVVGLSDT